MKTEPEVRTLGAGKFKAICLQLMDEVTEKPLTIIITKRGKAVAQLSAPLAELPAKTAKTKAPASPEPSAAPVATPEKHGKKKDKGKKKKHK